MSEIVSASLILNDYKTMKTFLIVVKYENDIDNKCFGIVKNTLIS